MSIISQQTQDIMKFAAVTTTLRGDSGWTIKDCLLLSLALQHLGEGRHSDEAIKTVLKSHEPSAIKRINQLKNEWYRSLDYRAANAG